MDRDSDGLGVDCSSPVRDGTCDNGVRGEIGKVEPLSLKASQACTSRGTRIKELYMS